MRSCATRLCASMHVIFARTALTWAWGGILIAAMAMMSSVPAGAQSPPWPWKRLEVNHDPLGKPWLRGLEKMSEDRSPSGSGWTNSVALCAVMKDENVTDVREWLQYYEWLGVDHVFLYDNDSADKTIIDQLRPLFSSRYVTFAEERQPKAQLKVYAQCMEEQRQNFNWMMFFDLDEYLVIRDKQYGGLKGVLNDYKNYGGLSVHWIFVGPGGRHTRSLQGGVLRDYTKCVPEPTARVKTIANTWFLDGTTIHPHNHWYRDDVLAVNEMHQPLELTWKLKPGIKRTYPRFSRSECPSNPEHCMFISNWRHEPTSARRIALFHYATKSYEDFNLKMKRGSGMSLHTKDMRYLQDIARNETDDPICKEPSALADLCCRQRRLASSWY